MRYIKTFIILSLLILIGCSRKNEKQLIESAGQKMRANDVAGAISEYKIIVAEFPSSPGAVEALVALADVYYRKKDATIDSQASLRQAIDYNAMVVKNFPGDKEAPKAQFMIGFIYANELGKNEEAKAAYEKFLKNYPNHELAQSARDEIRFLGVPAEEIIKQSQKISAGKK